MSDPIPPRKDTDEVCPPARVRLRSSHVVAAANESETGHGAEGDVAPNADITEIESAQQPIIERKVGPALFDTLAFSKRLERSGMDREPSDGLTFAIHDLLIDLGIGRAL